MFGPPWKLAYANAACCAHPQEREFALHERSPAHEGGPWTGSPFGVRRPLRFLAAKLELDDAQVRRLAEILDELKTERAQAAVDDRRTLTAFAEALAAEAFDATRAAGGAALRSKSTDRVGKAVVGALERIHALLRPDQRDRFAYLIRTGIVAL
jgi:Spy/CpxP family protein refolding chaperone